MRLAILYVCLMCLLSAGPGCRDHATSSNSQRSTPAIPPEQVAVQPAVPQAETGVNGQDKPDDPLVARVNACQWKEFEQGLLAYLLEHPTASEKADHRLAALISAVAVREGTDNDGKYDDWLANTCRAILHRYQPISIRLQLEVVRSIRPRPGYAPHIPALPDMSERAKNARLIVDTWKRVEKLIDPNFDSSNIRNWPGPNYVPGAGDRYQPNTNPNKVLEPELRAEYLKIIAENERKIKAIETQDAARECAPKIHAVALSFLKSAYGSPPEAMDEYRGFLKDLGINETTQYIEVAVEMIDIMKSRIQMIHDNEALLKQFPPDNEPDEKPVNNK